MAWVITSFNPTNHEVSLKSPDGKTVTTIIPPESLHSLEARKAHIAKITRRHDRIRKHRKLKLIIPILILIGTIIYLKIR